MKNDSTYRSGIIAYASITAFMVIAGLYLIVEARFETSVRELTTLVGKNNEVWQRISSLSAQLVRMSEDKRLPPYVQNVIQGELTQLLARSGEIMTATDSALATTSSQFFAQFYKARLHAIMKADVKPSVKNYVNALSVTPSNLLRARYSSLLTVDAILLNSGAALNPLSEKKRTLERFHDQLSARRVPMGLVVLTVLVTSVWASWFGLLLPSIKRARERETQLMAAEERSRVTLRSIGDAVIVSDISGRLESMNPTAEKILGYRFSEVKGQRIKDFLKLYRSSDGRPVADPVEQVLHSGTMIGLANSTSLRTKTGEMRLIADAAAPIKYPDGNTHGVVVVFRDVTDEYALRHTLIQSDKLRVAGVLAGGMAHEFNNALAIISGAVEAIKSDGLQDREHTRHFSMIEQAIKRSSSLTNRLLAIGRRSDVTLAPIDLLTVVEHAVEVISRTTDRTVRITLDCTLEVDERTVNGDASAFESVFINLGLNSIQSIDGPGKIDVSLRSSGPPPGLDTDETRFVKVIWKDSGGGIKRENHDKIFEPFFTTKADTGGSGLGLSIIQSTVLAYAGKIEMESAPGQGTTFKIYLPITDQLPDTVAITTFDEHVPMNGKILIVDDEPSFLALLSEFLSGCGYQTFAAVNGNEALEIFTRQKDELDVVILDLNMPNISGAELAQRFHLEQPRCKIIVSSGYARSDTDVTTPIGDVYMKKPYELRELANAIARLLPNTTRDQ